MQLLIEILQENKHEKIFRDSISLLLVKARDKDKRIRFEALKFIRDQIGIQELNSCLIIRPEASVVVHPRLVSLIMTAVTDCQDNRVKNIGQQLCMSLESLFFDKFLVIECLMNVGSNPSQVLTCFPLVKAFKILEPILFKHTSELMGKEIKTEENSEEF